MRMLVSLNKCADLNMKRLKMWLTRYCVEHIMRLLQRELEEDELSLS